MISGHKYGLTTLCDIAQVDRVSYVQYHVSRWMVSTRDRVAGVERVSPPINVIAAKPPCQTMSEINRRSVLQSSQEGGRSGIPMALPPSAMKKSTQNKRLSVAGPAARGAYTPAVLAVPSTNPRQSLYRSQNMNPLLASASKHGRTPLTS